MQKPLKKDSKTKELNTKSFAKKDLMKMAKTWLRQFSDKHINETDQEFQNWLFK